VLLTKEETVKVAEECAEKGYLCSESVLIALSRALGVESEIIPRIATGFAAGMARTGQACGAFSGAVLGLGIKYGRDEPVTPPEGRVYWFSRALADDFRKNYGALTCEGVLGLDLDEPADYEEYRRCNMWANRCRDLIRGATGLAYDILCLEK
jgi:C_GCAxxG_C_C family probable redox protein